MQPCKQRLLKIFCLCMLLYVIGVSSVCARKDASIVICAETGTVLHQASADEITHPASLTKMMTLYLTFKALLEKKLKPHQKLPISQYASHQKPSKLGLKAGTMITVRDAILGLVTKSANDAAVVLAEALGKGSEDTFAHMMTQQARRLGMTSTVFKNASGLPDKQQITTARDMATLSRSLYKHFPEYFKVFKEQKFVYKGQVHQNHNHLLGKVKGVDGIKTGFINASGFNLAASMVRDNRRIIAVVMGGETAKARDKKMVRLLEATYTSLTGRLTPQQGEQYASIAELIHAMGPSEAYADSSQTGDSNIKKAVYLSNSGQVKTLKAKYLTVDDILNIIEDAKPDSKGVKRKMVEDAEPAPKEIKKKNVIKKTPSKKSKQKKETSKKNSTKKITKKTKKKPLKPRKK